MKLKELHRKALVGGAVSLGTAGLSTCSNNGAVDPAPPPLACQSLDFLRDLQATVSGTTSLFVARINYVGDQSAEWRVVPHVTVVEGASVGQVRRGDNPRQVIVELAPQPPLSGRVWFVLEGSLEGSGGGACLFQRGFTITYDGESVRIAENALALPFDAQTRASIVVTHREGYEVGLRAVARPAGRSLVWTVTAGTFRTQGDDGMVWTLPREAGLYQAELLVDHGADGFAFDTLVIEVKGDVA